MSSDKNIRIPQQARSIEKKKRIVDAAIDLFSEQGFQGTNAKEIASSAGVSVGTFYAYYKDKKTLLVDILGQHVDDVDQSIFHELTQMIPAGASGREIIRRAVEVSHKTHHHSPGLLRTMLAMRYTDEDIARLGEAETEALIDKFSMLLGTMKDRLRVTDMEAAARIVTNAFKETMHSVAVFGPKIEQDRLFEALIDMTATYLFKDPDEKP